MSPELPRPKSIRLFEALYIASTLAGLAGRALFIIYPDMDQVTRAGLSYGFFVTVGLVLLALFALVLPLGLSYLAARQRMKWAFWAIVVIGAFSAVLLVVQLMQARLAMSGTVAPPWPYGLAMPFGIFGGLLHMASLVFLLKADARAWLNQKPVSPAPVPSSASEA